jgi:hypothetical protein
MADALRGLFIQIFALLIAFFAPKTPANRLQQVESIFSPDLVWLPPFSGGRNQWLIYSVK